MNVTQWHGCYSDSWQGVITPDAFAHPAKYARGLIRRIYQHMLDSGYVARGDSIIDPFGGVALGGLDAMTFGLHWTGVELEPRFVELGQRNIEKWRRDLAMLNGTLGTARLLQGDSRRLAAIVGGGVAGVVSSPPYDTDVIRTRDAGNHEPNKQGAMKDGKHTFDTYGSTPGQLGSMRSGDFAAAVVSSPPYADAIAHNGEGPGARHDPIYHNGDNAYKQSSANGYGTTPGNLGSMAGEGFEAAVSSPPYEASDNRGASNGIDDPAWRAGRKSAGLMAPVSYEAPANIGNDNGETFWAAARIIVEQTYLALRPGGYAVWVTKRFVRNGAIVEFSEQWAQLCEAAGFTRVEWIRAMLVESHGEQLDIFGNSHKRERKRASFFRRLYENKYPHNSIDWEDVLIMRKPCPLT